MPALSAEIRSTFERAVIKARATAEAAARAALATLAVERDRAFDGQGEPQRALRRALRARARQLGQGSLAGGLPLLVEEIAYEQWHRMLFARFLAENHLLMHPEGVAVTLAECGELAREEPGADQWDVATRFAAAMLPGIFRADDPTLQVRFAPEGRHRLEQIVGELPRPIFTSDDGLGWSYQFWQSAQKKAVNASERKIGGADIAPVTQLFTEDYMVRFLLENTLGAWWAARRPGSPLNATFDYLRFRDDGTPAAGTFAGWPDEVAAVTMIDPCGGSGHFVVAAFEMLRRMRMEAEGLSAAAAGDAVIRDNVHMLEIDPRCTQIAAFNLALAAWKSGGYRQLPAAAIACSGVPVAGQLDDWLKLAGGDANLRRGLERLYELFRHAPDLGSLIDPAAAFANDPLFNVDFDRLAPLLRRALAGAGGNGERDPDAPLFAAAVLEAARAAELLAGKYVLVATNVPFLGQNKQEDVLARFLETHHPTAKSDLASAFLERCLGFLRHGRTSATVSPQNWLFLSSYRRLRETMLRQQTWTLLAWIGAGGFETISGEVVKPVLLVCNRGGADAEQWISGIDVSSFPTASEKCKAIQTAPLMRALQADQLLNPDARVSLHVATIKHRLLSDFADSYWGIGTGDSARFQRQFWEVQPISGDWELLQSTFSPTAPFAGKDQILYWQNGEGDLYMLAEELKDRLKNIWRRGSQAWGKQGVAISQTGGIFAALYNGEIFQNGVAAVIPKDHKHLPALWAFLSSSEYRNEVRKIDRKLGVTNLTLIKVPFDLPHWQQVAAEQYPNGLPAPHSNDPTQWLFKGHPAGSDDPLHVAVARLLGYRWPEQGAGSRGQLSVGSGQAERGGGDGLDGLADEDGIVCLPAVGGEDPAHERLRRLLAAAYGEEWSAARQAALLAEVGYAGQSPAEWLRDAFFAQHCRLFHNRPFIWHVWDGRKDGFGALLNTHKLDHARLERLIYTYLGDWIATQQAEATRGTAGADGRLVASLALKQKLERILAGEPPHDVYVRWKPLHKQPIGWRPDLTDGVRLNIRPWVTAGVLRARFTINWNKDRGKNPDGGERLNDLHLTRAEKEAARRAAQEQTAGL